MWRFYRFPFSTFVDPSGPLCCLLCVYGGLLGSLPRLCGPLGDLFGTSWPLSGPSWEPLGVLLGTPPGNECLQKKIWEPKAAIKAPLRRKIGCISLFLNPKIGVKSIFGIRKCKKTRVLATCVGHLQNGPKHKRNDRNRAKEPRNLHKNSKTPFSPRFQAHFNTIW